MTAYVAYGNGQSLIQTSHTDPAGGPGVCFYTAEFDASKLTLTTADTAQLFNLPLGCYVEDVFVNVLTADAGGGTLNVGDAAAAAAYGNFVITAAGVLAPPAGTASTYLYTVTTNAKLSPKLINSANLQNVRIAPVTASVTTMKVRVTVKVTFTA